MSDHVVPLRIYVAIFAVLLIMTGVTIFVAYLDLGALNTVVAMSIACFKALLVILYFMHVRYGSRLVWVMIGGGVVWLLVLLVLLMGDYASRGWLPFPGK